MPTQLPRLCCTNQSTHQHHIDMDNALSSYSQACCVTCSCRVHCRLLRQPWRSHTSGVRSLPSGQNHRHARSHGRVPVRLSGRPYAAHSSHCRAHVTNLLSYANVSSICWPKYAVQIKQISGRRAITSRLEKLAVMKQSDPELGWPTGSYTIFHR